MDRVLNLKIKEQKIDESYEKNYGDSTIEVNVIRGSEFYLKYWNSSNNQPIDHDTFLNEMLYKILDEMEYIDGSLTDGWNEIMFEFNLI